MEYMTRDMVALRDINHNNVYRRPGDRFSATIVDADYLAARKLAEPASAGAAPSASPAPTPVPTPAPTAAPPAVEADDSGQGFVSAADTGLDVAQPTGRRTTGRRG